MKNKSTEIVLFILFTLLVVLSFAVLPGCMTVQKATSYLDKKNELPKICADRYPVKDSIVIHDSIITDTMETFETLIDTVHHADTVIITRTLPAKLITKTITQTKEIYKENTARIEEKNRVIDELGKSNTELANENSKLKQDNRRLRGSRDKWFILFLIAAAFNFRKQFLKLLKFI